MLREAKTTWLFCMPHSAPQNVRNQAFSVHETCRLQPVGNILQGSRRPADTAWCAIPALYKHGCKYIETKRTGYRMCASHSMARAVPSQEFAMLHYAVVFLVIALIAAVFGFGGIAAGAVGIAKVLFFVFVIMAVVTFVIGLVKRG